MDVNHKDAVALEKMMLQEKDMIAWILEDVAMMNILRQVQSLGLPDWCICAGFVRSKVWDKLHGFAPSRLPDVDVVYFDRNHKEESEEKKIERWLRQLDPSIPWSVKNQARMHIKNGQAPYTSTADGLANFPEVCTAIGVRMHAHDELELIAPYGIDDLVNLLVRPTPFFMSDEKRAIYEERLATKKWETIWPHLCIMR